MARTSSKTAAPVDTKLTGAVEMQVKTENAGTETAAPVDTENKEQKTSGKGKSFNDDDTVKIKCKFLAGKKVVCKDAKNPVSFSSDGIAEVNGLTAKYLLSIPGYELVK